MFARPLSTVIGVTALAAMTACSTPMPRDERVVYQEPTRQVPAYAEYGRVENIGPSAGAPPPRGAGAVLGAVIGAVVGNQVGSGTGRALATGAGAVGGAVAGNAIEGRTRRDDELYRVQVRFDNGTVRDFDFERIGNLYVGDRVKFEGGQLYRQ